MNTLATAAADAARRLAAAGIEEPRREARYLICHALGLAPEVPVLEPEPERSRGRS